MAEDKKSESHKPSDKKHEEHKGEHKPAHKAADHKAAEHTTEHKGAEHKPAHKPTEHKAAEHKGEHKPAHKASEPKTEHKPAEHKTEHKPSHKAAERSEKPVGKSDKATGAHKKTQAAEHREAGRTGGKTSPQNLKKPAPKKTEDVKIVDTPTEKKHVARSKANLTDEQRKALSLRDTIAGRRPWFRRTQWYEYKRLANTGWRRPRGVDSAMRRHFGYEQPVVRVGFAGPKSVRGLHASGFQEVYVEVLSDLKKIDTKTQAARVSGTLGTRKLRIVYDEADKLGVRILNRRQLPPPPKAAAKPAATDKAATAKPATPSKGG
ncbi:MAG TPA: 50S ribosomal protein L32e [Candidatus Thermoplasmatota archaeon]